MTPSRAARAAPLAIAPLVVLLVFHRALFCWFQQDDLSWLRLEMHTWEDFWRLLIEPRAQGTIRPLSERFFFIIFRRVFDLNAFPYHLFVFLTQLANLLLLTAIARRLTGRPWAGVPAALIWGLNIALVSPMAWVSAYNQILCSFFYLAGFYLFLRHIETGLWRWYILQCFAFLLGFGALETIVAYPVVVLCYCLLLARPHAWKAAPLMLPSALYATVHLWVIPRAESGPYALYFDAGILGTLWDYWTRVLGPVRFSYVVPIGRPAAATLTLALTLALLMAFRPAGRGERRAALFGIAWFVCTLAPVLPLREHRLDYYATIPAIGLALAAAALAPVVPRYAAAAWLAVYLVCSAVYVRRGVQMHYDRSHEVRRFLQGVQQVRRIHPDKTILLTGVTDSLYYGAVYDDGFRTAGVRNVYLAPTNEGIARQRGMLHAETHRLPAGPTLAVLEKNEAVIYEAAGGRLQNITSQYKLLAARLLKREPPRRVNVGEPPMAVQLGPGWHGIQAYHRWMGQRAEVRLAGPRTAEERLRVQAIYPQHLNPGVIRLSVFVNGVPVGRAEIRDPHSGEHVFSVPRAVVGLEEITVTLETDRVLRVPDDPRELGIAFGVIELVG